MVLPVGVMKKKPISLQPYHSRMQQRARAAAALPASEQGAFYYCGGRSKADFTAAMAAGEAEAVALALDVVAGELWLCPRDGARYARSIRAALRTACKAGLLDSAQMRVMYAIEMRNLERLLLRGRHSAPGVLQQRAERRIPGQLQLMQLCFGEAPELLMDSDEYPDVTPPKALLQKAVQYGWFSAETAARMAAGEEYMLSELVHGPWDIFPDAHMQQKTLPVHSPETLCYFFCWRGFRGTRWVVAPWGQLGRECGFILAADASFYCNVNEYDGIHCASR